MSTETQTSPATAAKSIDKPNFQEQATSKMKQVGSSGSCCESKSRSSSSNSTSGNSSCEFETEEDEQQNAECFVDANEEFHESELEAPSGSGDEDSIEDDAAKTREIHQAELKQRLEETTVILRKALNNEFIHSLDLCSRRIERDSQDLYASLAHAVLSFLRAALTMEHSDLQEALTSVNYSFKISGELRRKTSMVMKFLYRPQYNSYTDLEIHAELVHAESLLVLTLISFLADQSILCLVRGAFRIRACYQRYKECLYILEARSQWQSDEARRHFESGVRMGHGIFNLLMSYLPSRVLRFLQYVGFSGNRTLGVDEVEKSVALDDGLRSVFSTLVILCYHTYVENLFGLGAYDMDKVVEFNEKMRTHFPNSAFYLLFLGRQQQMQGQSTKAIETYHRCIEAQNDWKQFHSICHWEIMWCYAVQMKWKQAAEFSDLQRKTCKWSPASYTYQYATFLYAQLVEDERRGLCSRESSEYQSRMDEIKEIMRQVPDMRIRYAGKTIPAEKFAIVRSEQFFQRGDKLTLPAVEFLYVWNIFVTLTRSSEQVANLLDRINSEIDYLESDQCQEDDFKFDSLALVHLLKGMCLKQLERQDEAEVSFVKVIEELEPKVRVDTFIVPHTVMELSVMKLARKRYDEAKKWIKLARANYTGYLMETILHFRLHAASRAIRLELDELEARDEDFEESAEMDEAQESVELVLPEVQNSTPIDKAKDNIIHATDNKTTC